MDSRHLRSVPGGTSAATPAGSAPDSADDVGTHERYCPTELLASFALLMAGHGRCVNTDMMLGDREYAMWQLACAHARDDAQLDAIARRLAKYFDDPQHSAVPVLGTA